MHLRPNSNNSRREKLHRKDFRQVRKYNTNHKGKKINTTKHFARKKNDQPKHHHMTRRTKTQKKHPCKSCQQEQHHHQTVKESHNLNPKLVLRRCAVQANTIKQITNVIATDKKLHMNPVVRLQKCNVMRYIRNNQLTSKLGQLMPKLTLHRCKVAEVLDHRVVEPTKFEMFMVELYPMLIRTWVNPRDFSRQKCLFDEYKKRRYAAPPVQILSFDSVQRYRRIIILARRIAPNGEVNVLWN